MCIVFRKGLNIDITKKTCTGDGRAVIVDCKINDKEIRLVNSYVLNDDKSQFFLRLFELIATHKCTDMLIMGDFNLVIDKKLNSCNWKNNSSKEKDVLLAYMDEMLLDLNKGGCVIQI